IGYVHPEMKCTIIWSRKPGMYSRKVMLTVIILIMSGILMLYFPLIFGASTTLYKTANCLNMTFAIVKFVVQNVKHRMDSIRLIWNTPIKVLPGESTGTIISPAWLIVLQKQQRTIRNRLPQRFFPHRKWRDVLCDRIG